MEQTKMVEPANCVLCCDWGTSSLRLRLVEAESVLVLEEIVVGEGVSKTFDEWQYQSLTGISQEDFFRQKLSGYVELLQRETDVPLTNLQLIISGMASSSIGMAEVPYAGLPFATDGSQTSIRVLRGATGLFDTILLASGVKSNNDVMRGEETQLVGLLSIDPTLPVDYGQYIFPGTHSKHITVIDGAISSFRTFMTGEVFELLRVHSILKQSVQKPEEGGVFQERNYREAFIRGLREGCDETILNALFQVRANGLFGRTTPEENYFFLSGLLLGSELASTAGSSGLPLIISAGPNLASEYRLAAEELRLNNTILIDPQVAEMASVAGQLQVIKKFNEINAL